MSKTDKQIKDLVKDVKALVEKIKTIDTNDLKSKATAKAQDVAGVATAQATATYADVVKKGEEVLAAVKSLDLDEVKKVIASLKKQADTAADRVEKAADKVEEAAKKAEAAVANAVKKAPAKKAPAKKAPAKKAPVKKAPAKKAPAKKAPAKKAPAKKAPAKKA